MPRGYNKPNSKIKLAIDELEDLTHKDFAPNKLGLMLPLH